MSKEGVAGFHLTKADVALLVDGENLSAQMAPTLLAQARKMGRTRVVRVYGRCNELSQWLEVPGFVPVLTDARPQSADIRLAIDAVTLALGDGIRNFVIGSSDVDFAPLALHLREHGCTVMGAGSSLASDRLRGACSSYEVMAVDQPAPTHPPISRIAETPAVSPSAKPSKPETRAQGSTNPRLWTLVKQSFDAAARLDGWLTIKEFRLCMAERGLDDSEQNWKVQIRPYLGQCELRDHKGSIYLRLRQPRTP
jgi:hypothetical protein